MRGSRLYLLFLFIFLVLVFLVEYMGPHQFVWKPTFDKYDKEPLGSFVFDDVLSSSIANYSVVNKTFYQLYQEDSITTPRAFLLTEVNLEFNVTDFECLLKFIHLGNQVMICTDAFHGMLRDTLAVDVNYSGGRMFKNMNESVRDSIFFGTDTLQPERIFEVFPQVHPIHLVYRDLRDYQDYRDYGGREEREEREERDDGTDSVKLSTIRCDSLEVLVWDKAKKPLVLRLFMGKGELFMVSTPLMFTNFGMLDGDNASYAFRLLSFMKDKPLIRVEAYGPHDEKPRSQLRYVLSVKTLRWATYSILSLIILFMFFTAKRRQRIIPVIQAPPNRTFGFMQLISNLYYQKHNNVEILKMKYRFFCAEVKSLTGIDLFEKIPNESDYERLMEKTGIEKEVTSRLLYHIRLSLYREETSDSQLQHFIDGMNTLTHSPFQGG